MNYGRVAPRSRNGATGLSEEKDLAAGEAVWISPPDRVAAITVAVHITSDTGRYTIECCCNRADIIGSDGTGGHWDVLDEGIPEYTDDRVYMLANAVTGIRVKCIDGAVNVCFVG